MKAKVIYQKKSGSKKVRVASYFNRIFQCYQYEVEEYKKAGLYYGWYPVGNLSAFDEASAKRMLDERF